MPATVITDPAKIEEYRLRVIRSSLNLEVKTGLRHSTNAPTIAARQILQKAGKKAPRHKKNLAAAFHNHLLDLGMKFDV